MADLAVRLGVGPVMCRHDGAIGSRSRSRRGPCSGRSRSVYAARISCIYKMNIQRCSMPLHIRDDRAATLARRLAKRKGVTMTDAVIGALEDALAREQRPLAERIAEIADDLERVGN